MLFVSLIPYTFIYGIPAVSMLIYLVLGQHIGLDGHVVKFFLLHWSRYLGLLWHLVSLAVSTSLAGYDPIWAVVNASAIATLEYVYFANGADAVRYVDPEWTQGENTFVPF